MTIEMPKVDISKTLYVSNNSKGAFNSAIEDMLKELTPKLRQTTLAAVLEKLTTSTAGEKVVVLSIESWKLDVWDTDVVTTVGFNSTLHKGLYTINENLGIWTIVFKSTRYQLTRLGLLTGDTVTEKGQDALRELTLKGPRAKGKVLDWYIANRLLRAGSVNYRWRQPDFDWLRNLGLVDWNASKKGYITTKGKEWLASRAASLLKTGDSWNRTYWSTELVGYLPVEELPQFLCHEVFGIRTAALKRYEELTGEQYHKNN